MAPLIELKDETEGQIAETSDIFFQKIGDSVPVKPKGVGDGDSTAYELESLPCQALAVSERFQLVFVAHSSGFCVARTGDVMEAAKEIKNKRSGSSVVELSIVDVSIGRVRILSLSPDSSTLAASVGRDVHFFTVASLLNKEQAPVYSCSVEESSFLKDLRWLEKMENLFILLSSQGKLYRGSVGSPPECVMDDVDAVDVKGNFMAVARGNTLSIFSSKMIEKLCMSLSSNSWTKYSGEDCRVKVDSIRWIRPDSVVLGCFELNSDGMEENYFVEVIRSKSGWINHAEDASEIAVETFYDAFLGIIDDILPTGDGPYLYFGYLDQCKLAIIANRKNTDQHIMSFSWSLGEEENEVVIVDFNNEKWMPRIEIQENGDDNLILGLCVDKVSMRDKVKVQLGVEEERELTPHCVLLCLTLEGKLNMSYVASMSECADSLRSVAELSDEEEEIPAVVSLDHGGSSISLGLGGPTLQNGPDIHKKDHKKEVTYEIPVDASLKLPEIKVSPLSTFLGAQSEKRLDFSEKGEAKLFTHMKASEADGYQRVAGEVSASASIVGQPLTDGTSQWVQNQVESGWGIHTTGSSGFQISPSQTWGSGKTLPSTNFGARFMINSNDTEGNRSESSALNAATSNVPGTLVGKPEHLKESAASTLPIKSFSVPQQIGQKASSTIGHIESLPSVRSSQLSIQEAASGFSSTNQFISTQEVKRSGPQPGISKMEPSILKHIKEMIKELDMLLDSIEGKGGYKDACIIAQKIPVEALEKGIDTLSVQCTMWKGVLDERLEEVQQLLDKTVQVLSRKTYIKGIVKQATDDRYWELWNRQKLNPELELKRRHIMKLNQDLTNQLVILERHFNALELEKFSDSAGGPRFRQAYQNRFGPSRSVQSLHALHNTMTSQLAAAEQLSDCLSRQMGVLSIDSPPVRPKSVKKELFDTIGLPYDDSFSSPAKVIDTPSAKKLMISSNSAAIKDQSRRKQLSALKPSEPETARRRRDSLGQGWTSFEPPKTTVKRMLLQESRKVSASKPPFSVDEQHVSSSERTAAVRKNRTTPSTFSFTLANDGVGESSESKLFQSPFMAFSPVNESPESEVAYQTNIRTISSTFRSSLTDGQITPSSGTNLAEPKPIGIAATAKPFAVPVRETKPWSQPPSETTLSERKPGEMSGSTGKWSNVTRSPFEVVQQEPKITEGSPQVIVKLEDTFSSSSFGKPIPQALPALSAKVPQFGFGSGKGSSSESSSSTTTSVKTAASSEPPLGGSLNVSKPTVDANQSPFAKFSLSQSLVTSSSPSLIFSTSTTSTTSSFSVAPSSSFSLSFPASKPLATSSSLTFPVNSTPELREPKVEPDLVKVSPKPEPTSSPEAAPLPKEPLPSEPTPSSGLSQEPTSTSETSSGLLSRNEISSDETSSPASSTVALNAQPEQPSTNPVLFPTPATIIGSATFQKVESPEVAAPEEDGMEEEAPETSNNAPSFNLGSLSAFGLGTNAPAAPKANPFGSFGNMGPPTSTPSPFTTTVPSGELFRPASFSYQPQTSQPSQPQSSSPFSGGFSATGASPQAPPTQGGFGQPAQVGGGQQALGSVLGSFGQSRQIGLGLPGAGLASSGGITGGYGGAGSIGGGFSNTASSGGFAGMASKGAGFGALASGGGGFAGAGFANVGSAGGATPSGGGFGVFAATASGGGGFSGAAPGGGSSAAGGGFGSFGGQQAAGGFSAFGGSGGNATKPPELFTQMRK